jgi:hypothetical protein
MPWKWNHAGSRAPKALEDSGLPSRTDFLSEMQAGHPRKLVHDIKACVAGRVSPTWRVSSTPGMCCLEGVCRPFESPWWPRKTWCLLEGVCRPFESPWWPRKTWCLLEDVCRPQEKVLVILRGQRGLNPVWEIVWSEGECVIGIAFNQLRVAALLNEGECYEYSQLAGVGIRSQPPRVGRPVTHSWTARHPESE